MFDEVVRQGDRMTYRVLVRLKSIPATTDALIDYLNTYDVALERSGLVDCVRCASLDGSGPDWWPSWSKAGTTRTIWV